MTEILQGGGQNKRHKGKNKNQGAAGLETPPPGHSRQRGQPRAQNNKESDSEHESRGTHERGQRTSRVAGSVSWKTRENIEDDKDTRKLVSASRDQLVCDQYAT